MNVNLIINIASAHLIKKNSKRLLCASLFMAGNSVPPFEYDVIRVPPVGQPRREELFKQCCDLRIEVFCKEQGFPEDEELDE